MSIELTPVDVALQGVALDLTEGEVLELAPVDVAIAPVSISLSERAGVQLGATAVSIAPVSAFLGARGTSISLAPTAATFAGVPLTLRSDPVVALPSIVPSSRSLRPAKHPQTRTVAQDGASEGRLWASAAGGASMELSFRAITDADAELIMAAHDNARGGRAALSVPSAIYEGLSATLLPYYDLTGTGLTWTFDGPPRTRSVAEGYADVEVRLRARRVVRNSFVSAGVVGIDLESGVDGGVYGDCDVNGATPDPLPIDPDSIVVVDFQKVVFWADFEGNTNDKSRFAWSRAITGSVSTSSTPPLLVQASYGTFTGTGAYVTYSNSATSAAQGAPAGIHNTIHPMSGQPFGISAYCRNTLALDGAQSQSTHSRRIFNNISDTGGFELRVNNATGKPEMIYRNGSGTNILLLGGSRTSVQFPAVGTDCHLEVSFNGSTYWMFLDGVIIDERPVGSAFTGTVGSGFDVGRWSLASSNSNWRGRLDELLIVIGQPLHTVPFTPTYAPYDLL